MPLLRTLALALAATALAAAEELPVPVQANPETAAVLRVHRAGRLTYAFSPVTGSALFVAAHHTPDRLLANVDRTGHFRGDPNVPRELRVVPSMYEGTPYDRGHLEPFDLHRFDDDDQASTFVMSNVVPMVREFNRGLWRQIEAEAKRLLESRPGDVVTLPVYDFRTKPIKFCGNAPVPTRIAKAVLLYGDGKPEVLRAWMAANEIPAAGVTAADCLVPADDVEAATQFDLYPWLDDELETRLESQK